MIDRRRFLAAASLALAAPSVLRAQSASPLELTVNPEAVDPTGINLPPTVEGSYQIPAAYQAAIVNVQPGLSPNDIHIVPQSFHLYFILPGDRAIRYGVAVGQEGLGWSGAARIGRKVEWPSWRPTDEMIERNPSHYAQYADGMPGGPDNPLGARAMYLFQGESDTHIRVHGTTSPASIGHSASNGCFRMFNSHVIDLYQRVPIGAGAFAYAT